MFALLLGLVTAAYAYRIRELKRRQEFRLGIAGRLHDDIGANLSTIALKAGLLEGASTLESRHRNQLSDVSRLARESALKVRETVWVVNTKYDTLAGLVTKMNDTADMMLTGPVALQFKGPSDVPDRKIPMELRQDVYLAFKEALQNVLTHAQATAVEIEVGYDKSVLSVRISDNGRGFPGAETSDGNGLGLMRARMTRHKGSLTVSSTPGGGATISMQVRA
jgi:signal transduction histidine kinase